MQKKRKILWICISCICVAIILASVLIHFVFKLKTVDVEFQSRLNQENTRLELGVQDEIKKYFKYGENMILMDFSESINEVEKNHPFIRVNQVIKFFPNIVRVYISERIPKYKVRDSYKDDDWYILDEEFKVLRKINESDDKYKREFDSVIEIEKDTLKISAEVGEFIVNQIEKEFLNQIITGVYGRTEDFSIVKSISIKKNNENSNYIFALTMKNIAVSDGKGCTIITEGGEKLTEKIFRAITTYQDELATNEFVNLPSTTLTVYYIDGEYKTIKTIK